MFIPFINFLVKGLDRLCCWTINCTPSPPPQKMEWFLPQIILHWLLIPWHNASCFIYSCTPNAVHIGEGLKKYGNSFIHSFMVMIKQASQFNSVESTHLNIGLVKTKFWGQVSSYERSRNIFVLLIINNCNDISTGWFF